MHNSRTVSGDNKGNFLDYLKSLLGISGNVDITVRKAVHVGLVQVRQGRTVAAAWGRLAGNGALLTLAAMPEVVYEAAESTKPADGNVTLTLPAAERLLNTLLTSPGVDAGDEEEKLQQAIHLFYQFRRKEAGALLVGILRTNRFYYPAWLWHSRLMTRAEYIKKALNEAKKWGNCDREIQLEAARIEPRLEGAAVTVKRCIFCWSVVQEKADSCSNCQGMFHIAGQKAPPPGGNAELEKAIVAYKQEFAACPGNPRIAYCLCLAFYSLGRIDQAIEFVDRAMRVSSGEALFLKARTLLQSFAGQAVQPVPQTTQVVRPIAAASSGTGVPDRTILVVEDSQTSRKVITMLLERKGYTIQEAKNGSEALVKLADEAPDLVLLDLMLPDMSGYEVLAKIRQGGKTADIPVIMLTGKSNPADRMKGLHHGSNEYLTKPFDPAKLLAVLEKYLDHPAPQPPAQHAAPPKVVVKTVPQAPKAPNPPVPAPKPASVDPAPLKPTPVMSAVPAGGTAKKSILVVEDSPTSRKVISMVIAKRGYTIHEAATGAVAMRKAQEGTPSLILLDAMLPDMSGYEILHRFKNDERLKDVPVVMLTARNNPVDRQKGLQGGSAAYLTKPFDPEKLLAVIDEYI